jgi:hypothetical protein
MNSNVLQGATLVYPHEDLDGNGFVDILGAADDGRLVAISGGEMALAIENNSPNVPERFTLTQNFPNPFNPSTVFYVNMPATENAILEVFNALGQRVTELYRGKLTAGRHKFEFKAENLPSGIYFYRVVTQTQVLTRKMLLLR